MKHDDRIFISRKVEDLGRGDIVIFRYPADPTKSFIDRIVALPGEVAEIKQGAVYINGARLDEPYVAPGGMSRQADLGPIQVPEQSYFVMGDNRGRANDSTDWGPLPQSAIYGKYVWRYWAAEDVGVTSDAEQTLAPEPAHSSLTGSSRMIARAR